MGTSLLKERSNAALIMFFIVFLTIVSFIQSNEDEMEKNNMDSRTPLEMSMHLNNFQDRVLEVNGISTKDVKPSLKEKKGVVREVWDYGSAHFNKHTIVRRSTTNRKTRSAGNKVTENNSNLVCPSLTSCENKCSKEMQFTEGELVFCHCDQYCEFFQDCCYDYHHFCASKSKVFHECEQNVSHSSAVNKTGNGNDSLNCGENSTDMYIAYPNNNTINIDLNFFKCQPFRDKFDKAVRGVWMISDCANKDHPSYNKCTNVPPLNGDTIEDFIPVVDANNNVFRNQHCAQCNKAPILKLWRIDLECDVTAPSVYSTSETIDFLIQYCEKFAINPPTSKFPLRYCLNFISECPSTINMSESIVKGCTDGLVSLVHAKKYGNIPKENFKNFNCSLCNGRAQRDLDCGPNELGIQGGTNQDIKSFSIVMDFTRDTTMSKTEKKISVQCSRVYDVYDPYLEKCRSSLDTEGLPVNGEYDEYKIIMWMKSMNSTVTKRLKRWVPPPGFGPPRGLVKKKQASVEKEDFITAISEHLKINSTQVSNVDLQGAETGDEAEFELRIEPLIDGKLNRNRRSAEDAKKLLQVLQFKNPFDLPIGNQTYLVYKVVSRHITCLDTNIYEPNQYVFLPGGAVYINETGFEYSKKELYTDDKSGVKKVVICGSYFITNCSGLLIPLNISEYTTFRNRSIYRMDSKRLYEFWEYNSINGTVSICVSYSSTYTKTVLTFTTPPDDDIVLVILTIIGFTLSIICLLFVLVTYILFAKLRTLPGKNIMNLASALLMAHLLWLVGINRTDKPVFCTAVAVLLNYLFLVSFSWSAVISYDTCATFTQKGGPGGGANRDTVFVRYLVGAWSIPLAFIVIFLSLDKTGVYTVGYGTGDACWIATPTACVYLMAVPIGFVLIFNAVFFVRTVLAIKQASEVGQRARASGQRSEKQVFQAAVRLATLMGFTWIFGFAASWFRYLWYPFVVLTSLQGFYIALAFTMNRRVLNMYLHRCGLRKDEGSKSGSSSRATSSVNSRPSILNSCRKPKSHRTIYTRSNTEETKV